MELNFSWRTVLGTLVAYYASLGFYRLFLDPLARFPGPKLAALSRWYEAYYDVVQGGKYTHKIAQLHKRYGPIIRISPYELHVDDPSFLKTLYASDGGRRDKYAWAYDAFGAKTSTVFGSEHEAHKRRRGAIAPFFSKASVAARQDALRRNVDKLCRRIASVAGTSEVFNLGLGVSAFTRDSANEFMIGKTYDNLGLSHLGEGLTIASQGAGGFWRTTKHIRWFGPALRGLPVSWALKVADEKTKTFLEYLQVSNPKFSIWRAITPKPADLPQQSEKDTRDAMEASASGSSDEKVVNSMVHTIVHSNLPPEDKTFERVFEEVATATGAAFETTANVLRLILFHIYSNDEILGRLREELTSTLQDEERDEAPLTLKQLEQLPYLTAVLMEGLRLSPGIATRAARVTDKDLLLGDWHIPAGTPVGMTMILVHTDERLYPDPLRFDPERWVDATARREAGPKFSPFGLGTRMCLGMQ